MAKRKTPTTDLGEIRNPVKAAALMTCLPEPHVPFEVNRRADGVLCTFFHPTPDFLRDSAAYDKGDLAVAVKRFIFARRTLLDMKEFEAPDVSKLIRVVLS